MVIVIGIQELLGNVALEGLGIHGLGLFGIMFFRYSWCLCFLVCLDMMF